VKQVKPTSKHGFHQIRETGFGFDKSITAGVAIHTETGLGDGGLQEADSVVERHRLDVERAQDRLLVDEVVVVGARVASRQNDAHVAQVDVNRSQVGAIQRRTLQHNHNAIVLRVSFLPRDPYATL